jgi:hypothetical protein
MYTATVTTVTLSFLPSFLNTNRSAKEIAEARGKRAKTSHKGIPNAKTGACCTARTKNRARRRPLWEKKKASAGRELLRN